MTEPIPIVITIHRATGLRENRRRSWINPHRLYFQIDSGSSDGVRKTREIKGAGTTFEWNEEILYDANETLYLSLRSRSLLGVRTIIGTAELKGEELLRRAGAEIKVPLIVRSPRPGDLPLSIAVSAQTTSLQESPKLVVREAQIITDTTGIELQGDLDSALENGVLYLEGTLKSVVDVITDKMDIMAELHPYANIAWKACSALYRVIQSQRLTDRKLVSLVKTMNRTFYFLKNLEGFPTQRNFETLMEIINKLLQQTAECAFFMREYASRRFLNRELQQLWKDPNAKVDDFARSFKQLRQGLVTGALQYDVMVMSKVSRQVGILVQEALLKPTKMIASQRETCLPGTRKQLLAEIINWATQGDARTAEKNVLWLHGMAGSGKSTIATTIARYFGTLGRQGAYLFFDRATSTPSSVIRTLAYELSLYDPDIDLAVSERLKQDSKGAHASLKSQFENLLRIPLEAAAKKVTGPIIIVLDALDECGDQSSRAALLMILGREFATLPHIFRFLITSRAEEDIRSQFESSNLVMSLESMVEEDEAASDVQHYIQSQMLEIRTLRKISEGWPHKDEMKKLVQYSGGLFIWATMVQGLDPLYATALESSCQWTDDESWADFRSVMTVVLFARKHFNERAVDHLLGRTEENPCRLILSRLGCLLDFSPGQPIRPLHVSFRDYLTDNSRSQGKPWSLTSVDPERLLAECCLRVMSSQLHFNMFGIKTSYQWDRHYFEVNAKAKLSPELSYACENWWEHLRSVQTFGQSDTLATALSDFGSEQFLFWVEVVSAMRIDYSLGWSDSCQVVAKLTKKSDPDQAVLWEDAQRFLDMCWQGGWINLYRNNIIQRATPHIYLSALPFTPPTSKISQIYLPKFPNTLKVIFQQTNPPPDHTPLTGMLSHLGFSPDGNMLVSCFEYHEEGAVHIRSTQDYSLLPQYQACYHPDGIRVAKFSHDNHFLYCLTVKNALVSWESATEQLTEIHPTGVSDFDIYGEKIIACCEDGNLRIWTREELKFTGPDIIHIGDKVLRSITVSPDGLVAVSQEKSVHIVDIASQHILRTNTVETTFGISSLSFSDRGDSLAMAVFDERYQMYLCSQNDDWRATAHKKREETSQYGAAVTWLRGRPVVCIGWTDGTVSLWNVETQSIISGPLSHSDGLCRVAISPDGKTLATGTAEEWIKIWDVEMLPGEGESGNCYPFQIFKAENPQLFDGCKYNREWIIGPGDERLLWLPLSKFERNHALKYTTVFGAFKALDFNNFVHGEEWTKCYSGDVDGNQQE